MTVYIYPSWLLLDLMDQSSVVGLPDPGSKEDQERHLQETTKQARRMRELSDELERVKSTAHALHNQNSSLETDCASKQKQISELEQRFDELNFTLAMLGKARTGNSDSLLMISIPKSRPMRRISDCFERKSERLPMKLRDRHRPW
jgi:septal ring factor EnvC (AmiA/AmiB activator)